MPISDTSTEPDETRYSDVYSRRNILKAGATGLAASLAGCSALNNDGPVNDGGSTPPQPSTDGINFNIVELALDEVSFKMDSFPRPYPDTITVTAYRKPVLMDDSEKVQIGQSQYQSFPDTFNMDIDLTGEMDIAHQLIFTLSRDGDTPEEIYRTGNAILPFNNEAEGEQQVRVVGPPNVSSSDWSDPRGRKQRVDIWYNELDEPSFNMPALDMTQYTTQTANGEDWFDLYDIQLTVVIRSPVLDREFATDDEGDIIGPFCDWTVLNLELSALEYLESIYYNSPPTMKLFNPDDDWSVGNGGVRQKEVENKQDFGGAMLVDKDDYGTTRESPMEVVHVAQDANPASDAFIRGALHEQVGYEEPFEPDELRTVNPVKFCVGRSFTRRWGEKFSKAIEDKPYADSFTSIEYRKMTTLKAFVGDLDYQFTISLYQQTPEETIVNMFLRDTTNRDIPGSDCVTSTMLFIGIGHWMTGKHPVMVRTSVSQGLDHIFAGFHDLDIPDILGEIPEYPVASYDRFEESGRSAEEVEYTYTDVECTEPYPSIGFNRHTIDNTSRRLVAWSNLTEFDLTTQIPLNDNWEPDVNGTIRAAGDGYFRDNFVNPFDTTLFYYFEDERNR